MYFPLEKNTRCCIIGLARRDFAQCPFRGGRNYEENKLTYFVLKEACTASNKSKVKINKWLGVPNLKAYEKFLVEWHELTKLLRTYYADHQEDQAILKGINMKFLQIFYLTPYVEDDFYLAFQMRLDEMRKFLSTLGIV